MSTIGAENPHVYINNRKGYGLRVNKEWSDDAYMEQRDPAYFAIYLEDGDATGVGAVPSSEVKGSAYHKVLTPKGILLAPQNEDGKSEGACFDIIGRQVAK